MATVQIVDYQPQSLPYPFLSHPPQRKRPTPLPAPTQPLPPLPLRSPAFTAIATWAAHVQPGSPGSPGSQHSPRRRPSLSRRPRSHSAASRSPSARSFILVATPTTASTPRDFPVDLTKIGYTSLFVHLPHTPATPAAFYAAHTPPPVDPASFPVPPAPAPRAPRRFRSFSLLRSRAPRQPPSPTKSTRSATPRASPQIHVAAVVKRKKAAYAYLAPAPAPAPKHKKPAPHYPPTLAAELALLQFADGGSTDAALARLMAEHARATAAQGVAAPHRAPDGTPWWDADDALEYRPLLASPSTPPSPWVAFPTDAPPDSLARRGSALSASTRDSALGLAPVLPADADAVCAARPPPQAVAHRKPPVLSIPARARVRRTPGFVLDTALAAFVPPASPGAPRTPRTPRTPTSPAAMRARARGKARRRPAPLVLARPPVCVDVAMDLGVAADAVDVAQARREFEADAFCPVVVCTPAQCVFDAGREPSGKVKPARRQFRLGALFGR